MLRSPSGRGSVPRVVQVLGRPACIGWLGVTLALLGCPGGEAPDDDLPPSLPYQGVQLRFVVPDSLHVTDTWAPAINDWADENAAHVEIVPVATDGPLKEWSGLLAEPPTSLVLVPTAELGELVGARQLSPIPAATIEAGLVSWHSIPPGVRSAVGMLGEEPAFVPVTTPTVLVAIRSDLLEASGRMAPTTWAEYDRLVAEVSEWAPDHVAVEPRDERSLPTLFLARAISAAKTPAQLSVELDVTSGDPLIGSTPFARALEELQNLTSHLDSNVDAMGPVDCLQSLRNGEAAIGLVWSADLAADELVTAAEKGHPPLTWLPLPGRTEVYDRDSRAWTSLPDGEINRPALCGFAGLSACVTSVGTETEQAAAWDLWGLLEAYQQAGTIPSLGGEPVAIEEDLQRILQNPLQVAELPMSGRTRLRAALGQAIRRSLVGEVDARTALAEAQAEWATIIDKQGRAKVLNSYRQRLGLVPLAE